MQSGQNRFLVNILPLANINSNTSGLDSTTLLSNAISNLQTAVNTDTRTIYTDYMSAYTNGGAITFYSPINLCNVSITSNGAPITVGGGSVTLQMSSLGTPAAYITTSSSIVFGVRGSTMMTLNSNGGLLIRGGSDTRVSSMKFYADDIQTSTITVGETCYAKTFVTLSDESVKTNISTVIGIGRFEEINAYRFQYKEEEEPTIGLLAQEVEAVYPECVREGPGGLKYIQYNSLVALLLNAVKNLEARVRVLEG